MAEVGRSAAPDTMTLRRIRLGRHPALIAGFITVHVLMLVLCQWLGQPTVYALFIPVSAATIAVLSRWDVFTTLAITVGAIIVMLLAIPIILFVTRQDPSVVLAKAMDPAVHKALYLGVYAPLLAALVGVGLGVPLALCLARGFRGSALVQSLVDLPLVIPHSVAGLMVLFAYGRGGAFANLSVLGTLAGAVLAMVFVSAPFAINAARQAFEAVPERLEYAACVHGASPWQAFWRVTLPLARRGILVGGLLAWARSVSEFGAVAIVAYSVSFFYPFVGHEVRAQHAPVFVYNTFLAEGLAEAGAVGLLLLIVSAFIFLLIRGLTGSDNRARHLL